MSQNKKIPTGEKEKDKNKKGKSVFEILLDF